MLADHDRPQAPGPIAKARLDEAEERVRVAFPDARVLDVERLAGGLRNTNLRVLANRAPSPLVLRLYTADPAACAREIGVLGALPEYVLRPAMLHAEPNAEPPWALLSWIDGGPLDRMLKLITPSEAEKLAGDFGATLAAIHRLAFPRSGFLGANLSLGPSLGTWSGALETMLAGRAGDRLEADLGASLSAFVARHEREMDPLLGGEAVLCHGDYRPANLLARRSAGAVPRRRFAGLTWSGSAVFARGSGESGEPDRPRLAGIVDWEFAFAGPALFDFATFLRDERLVPPRLRDAFADGYRRLGGHLPADWVRLARRLDLVNLCQLIERGDDLTLAALRPLIDATLRRD